MCVPFPTPHVPKVVGCGVLEAKCFSGYHQHTIEYSNSRRDTGNRSHYHRRFFEIQASSPTNRKMSVKPINHDVEQPPITSYQLPPITSCKPPNLTSGQMEQRGSKLDQVTTSAMLMRFNCRFPLFTNQILDEYNMHWMRHINPVVFIPTLFVFLALFFSQCGLIGLASADSGSTTYFVRLIGLLTTFICDFFAVLHCTYHFVRLTGRDHEAFMVRLKEWFPFRLEDAMTITGLCAWSLLLIARILAGACPTGATLWTQQTCNPFAGRGGIPAGMVSSLYSIPLLAQISLRCISLHALVICYIISFAVVAFCVFHTKSSLYSSYPDLIVIMLFVNSSFEITRLQRLSFVDTLKAKEQEQMEIEQVKKEQKIQEEAEKSRVVQQLQLDRAEDEKRLKETETLQLRSLIGNVVHDLKTPLFAIEADMDMLKMFCSYISKDVVDDVTARLHQLFNLVLTLPRGFPLIFYPLLAHISSQILTYNIYTSLSMCVLSHRMKRRMTLNHMLSSRPCGPLFASWWLLSIVVKTI